MSILERLTEDMKAAMKGGDRDRLGTIRQLRAQLNNARIELGRDLTDDDAIAVLTNAAKKRKEAIEMYEKAGREDLVAKEKAELAVIQEYLPQQLSRQELEGIVDAVIKEVNATTMKDLGRVMGKVMQQVRGRADGKEVQGLVRSKLQ
ncbi:MAG: GatB/YqeY domain-containing protein [candidate division KSB1 bacterium]|nr:GatB/YqeY domain-containing protein [candidate division KSB1 bacterium]